MTSAANPEWPALLRDYEGAIADFERVSRALTGILAGRNGADDEVRALIAAEERARETVVLARIRLINLWRDSNAEPRAAAGPMLAPTKPQ